MIWILRSLPGGGKSYWTKNKIKELGEDKVEVFSADDWHTFNGVYKFDPKRAGYAHNEFFRCYTLYCQVEKAAHAIVDNTNTTLMELAPYVRTAEAFGKDYEIIYIQCDLKTAIQRNIHNVPHNTILQMQHNLQNEIVPPYWKQTVIFS